MRVYVASSWRNQQYTLITQRLASEGHHVYDWQSPEHAFQWSDIDPDWQDWSNRQFVQALDHGKAVAGFSADIDGLRNAEATVLLMPCGRSAHLELGYAVGVMQRTAILLLPFSPQEPELMYKMADLVTDNLNEVVQWLSQ